MTFNHNLPLSVFIIAKNEADRLPKTLSAVRDLTHDIILIDSGSIDDTIETAETFGARVLINKPFPGYGEQKRFGEDQCKYDWVLNIDADEVISPELHREIVDLFSKSEKMTDGYRIKIIDMLQMQTRPSFFAHSVSPVRLYKKSAGRYNPSVVHDRVDMNNKARIQTLNHPIFHYPIRSLSEQITKLMNYTDWQSADLIERKRTINIWRVYLEFPIAFLKAYILRRYILNGTYGFLLAINYAYFRLMRFGKAYEYQKGIRIKSRT